jgi:hypothetical protein
VILFSRNTDVTVYIGFSKLPIKNFHYLWFMMETISFMGKSNDTPEESLNAIQFVDSLSVKKNGDMGLHTQKEDILWNDYTYVFPIKRIVHKTNTNSDDQKVQFIELVFLKLLRSLI